MENLLTIFTETTSNVEPFLFLLPIGLIIIVAKILSIFCSKIGIPRVIGYLLSGLLLGLLTFIPGQIVFTDITMEGINFVGKIGVVLIMFSAGMETDLKQIKATGVSSIIITSLGVIVPLAMGAGLAFCFFPTTDTQGIWTNIFYGVLLTATSISITVSVLKELGKLNTKVGTCIESAAIIDDIIGIILLSIALSLGSPDAKSSIPFGITTGNATFDILIIIAFMIGFFVAVGLLWWPINKIFAWLNNKWPRHRRLPIFGIGFAFLMAYMAEKVFGVADVTGAFMAGLILSQTKSKEYIDYKTESESGIIFSSVFFASIGLMLFTKPMDFSNVNVILFGILFIIVGLVSKVIGAGIGGLISKFNLRESTIIGVGMMVRAEVIIVCAQKGIDNGIIGTEIMPFIIILIVVSSLIAPVLLQLLYKNKGKNDNTLMPQTIDTIENKTNEKGDNISCEK